MQLQPYGVVGELAAGETRPLDGVLALFNMLLRRAALIVECDDLLSRTGEVGHDKPDPGIEFARMPLDLGDDAAGFGPTGRLIAKVRVVPPHLLRRPADRAFQKVGDIALQDCVRRQPDRIAKALGFKEPVNARQGERRIAPEEAPQPLAAIAGDDRLNAVDCLLPKFDAKTVDQVAVSYTHLTLPTICSV